MTIRTERTLEWKTNAIISSSVLFILTLANVMETPRELCGTKFLDMTYILHMSKTLGSKNLKELMRDCNKYPSARQRIQLTDLKTGTISIWLCMRHFTLAA